MKQQPLKDRRSQEWQASALNKLFSDTLKATQNHIEDHNDLAVQDAEKSGRQHMNQWLWWGW